MPSSRACRQMLQQKIENCLPRVERSPEAGFFVLHPSLPQYLRGNRPRRPDTERIFLQESQERSFVSQPVLLPRPAGDRQFVVRESHLPLAFHFCVGHLCFTSLPIFLLKSDAFIPYGLNYWGLGLVSPALGLGFGFTQLC